MDNDTNTVGLATELTAAWLSNPNTRIAADDVPGFIKQMHTALTNLSKSARHEATSPKYAPAMTVLRSLASPDHIISLIDGKPYKTLRRHLAGHGMTPKQYRERYNLQSDYPMVAQRYSESRRAIAKKIGLDRQPGQGASGGQAKATQAPRAKKADTLARRGGTVSG